MKLLIAIFALVACTTVKAGATEEFLIRMGMYVAGGAYEGYRMSEAKERELAVMIGLKRFGPECERLSPSGGLDDCGDEVLPQSIAFGKQAVEGYKQCWKEADELPTGDETMEARGQCKYELEATEREFEAWSTKQKESAEGEP